MGQVGQEHLADGGRRERQDGADAHIHGHDMTAFLHRDDGRARVSPDCRRHRLVHAVPQARQRIVELANRAQAAEPDKADRHGRGPDRVVAGFRILGDQPGIAQAGQIAVNFGARHSGRRRQVFQREHAASRRQRLQNCRSNSNRLDAAPLGGLFRRGLHAFDP